MYYVYFLKSQNYNKTYIGYTSDLKQRFLSHNNSLSGYTSKFKPWKLVYYEAYFDKTDAICREKSLKKSTSTIALLKKRIIRSL
jgi:putative endonuclease